MSQQIDWDGETHDIPDAGERGWGPAVTAFLAAMAGSALSTIMTLAEEWDLGNVAGIRALWLRSQTASPAQSGVVRLARADRVKFRNQADSADIGLGPGTDNLLEWNSIDLVDVSTAQTLDGKTLTTANVTGTFAGTITATSWTNATLAGSWVTYGAPYATAGYRKRADGTVELRGAVKDGAAGTITTLPAGYRPTEKVSFTILSGDAGHTAHISISTAGVVSGDMEGDAALGSAIVVLNSIRFPTS